MTATERCGYCGLRFRRAQAGRVLIEASRPGIAGDGEGGCGEARDYGL